MYVLNIGTGSGGVGRAMGRGVGQSGHGLTTFYMQIHIDRMHRSVFEECPLPQVALPVYSLL